MWFWVGSVALAAVFIGSIALIQPDVVGAWRDAGLSTLPYIAAGLITAYEESGPPAVQLRASQIASAGDLRVWLYDAAGAPLTTPAPLPDAAAFVREILADGAAQRLDDGYFYLGRARQSPRGAQYAVIWRIRSMILRPIIGHPLRFAFRLLAVLATIALFAWLAARHITRPLLSLRQAARRYADGDLTIRVSARREFQRRDELSELAREFDQMASQIETLVNAQHQLLADISHELRSPLARLSLALELARRRLGDDVPEHQRMERDLVRLDDLIQQLLTLARLQMPSSPAERSTVDLGALVQEIAGDVRFEAEAAHRQVTVQLRCEATVNGNRELLRSALENVMRNAVRHTPEHTTVAVELAPRDRPGAVILSIRDCGPGVPAHALERLFDPFFRVEGGRDRASGGVGLGLAITRQAMLRHGGEARARNHPEGGLLILLELPAAIRPH